MHTKISSNIIKTITVLFFTLMSFSSVLGQSNLDFSYTGTYSEVTLPPGTYELEVWGAQGGGDNGLANKIGLGGRGGYSKGEIVCTEATTIYIYVGQEGFQSHTTSTAFNGGGSGNPVATSQNDRNGFTGGGATHMALENGLLSALSSNKDKVLIVAGAGGAGGGGFSTTSYNTAGGYGGGNVGGKATDTPQSSIRGVGRGGSQTSGGVSGYDTRTTYSGNEMAYIEAGFGRGASSSRHIGDIVQGGGGGGGWYGGGAGSQAGGGGGGGSGYVKTNLSSPVLTAGNASMPNPSGGSNIIGNTGNGFARITELRGNVTIVASGGADINNGWTYSNGLIKVGSNVNINASVIENYLSSGDLTIEAANIHVQADISSSTSNTFTLKALGKIEIHDNSNIQTSGGDLIVWANSENLNGGNILTGQNVTLDSRQGGASTGGGRIHLGGGADTNSDGFPDDATAGIGNASGGLAYGILFGNAAGSGVQLLSGGGDITLIGGVDASFTAAANAHGIGFYPGYTINAGAGNITFNGYANSGGATTIGIDLMTFGDTNASSITTTGDLTFNGESTVTTNTNHGIILNNGLTIDAGTVNITGNSEEAGVILNGSITSAGSMRLRANTYSFSSSSVSGQGTLTIEPLTISNSFNSTFNTNGLTLGSDLTGLTIGKSTNTAEVTITNAIDIAGPIEVYGGDIIINNSLNTTSAGTNGDILVKASGDISLTADESITTSGGDVILWANSDNQAANGSISLRKASSITTGSSSVTGGSVWLGGGADGGTWNDLTVGNGYAVSGTSFTPSDGGGDANAGVYFENATIKTNGGNILVKGDGGTNYASGITTYGGNTINSGNGTIEWDGKSSSSFETQGISFGLHDVIIAGNTSFNSTSTGVAVKLKGSSNARNGIGVDGIVTIESSGSGSIDLTGTGASPHYGIEVGNYYNGSKLNLYAASGEIKVDGGSMGISVVQTGNQGKALGDS
ncbi:MAG: glycine rich domain-containing protein, partial [Polaribacter sp.]